MIKMMGKNPAYASIMYPSHSYVAWLIIIYSKQDISRLRDEYKTFVEKLFDNSGHTFPPFFQNQGQGARVSVTQKQNATLCNTKMYPHTKF